MFGGIDREMNPLVDEMPLLWVGFQQYEVHRDGRLSVAKPAT